MMAAPTKRFPQFSHFIFKPSFLCPLLQMNILTNCLKSRAIVSDDMTEVNKKITIYSDLQDEIDNMLWFSTLTNLQIFARV
jgi:hypothetical protein